MNIYQRIVLVIGGIGMAVTLLGSASYLFAQTTTKEEVRIFNIIPIVSTYEPDKLSDVYYSIHNRADKPLEWVKIRIIVRNPDKEIIDTDDKKISFGKPMAPGLTKQMHAIPLVRGYCTSKGCGTVEIKLLDFHLVEK